MSETEFILWAVLVIIGLVGLVYSYIAAKESQRVGKLVTNFLMRALRENRGE